MRKILDFDGQARTEQGRVCLEGDGTGTASRPSMSSKLATRTSQNSEKNSSDPQDSTAAKLFALALNDQISIIDHIWLISHKLKQPRQESAELT